MVTCVIPAPVVVVVQVVCSILPKSNKYAATLFAKRVLPFDHISENSSVERVYTPSFSIVISASLPST